MKARNTSIGVPPNTLESLSEFCKRTKLTKSGFIEASLKYFNDYAINPTKHEKPTQEIEKMHKRIEDIFKFSKAQERDLLKPFLTQIAQSNIDSREGLNNLRNGLNKFLKDTETKNNEAFALEKKAHQEQLKILQEQKTILLQEQKKFINVILVLGEALEGKNKGILNQFKVGLGL